jgi:hypothetical protein
MQDPHELKIKAGREMLARAVRAVESGQWPNFRMLVDQDDPAIIVHILKLPDNDYGDYEIAKAELEMYAAEDEANAAA